MCTPVQPTGRCVRTVVWSSKNFKLNDDQQLLCNRQRIKLYQSPISVRAVSTAVPGAEAADFRDDKIFSQGRAPHEWLCPWKNKRLKNKPEQTSFLSESNIFLFVFLEGLWALLFETQRCILQGQELREWALYQVQSHSWLCGTTVWTLLIVWCMSLSSSQRVSILPPLCKRCRWS